MLSCPQVNVDADASADADDAGLQKIVIAHHFNYKLKGELKIKFISTSLIPLKTKCVILNSHYIIIIYAMFYFNNRQ